MAFNLAFLSDFCGVLDVNKQEKLFVGRLFGWVGGGVLWEKYRKVIQEWVVFFQLLFGGKFGKWGKLEQKNRIKEYLSLILSYLCINRCYYWLRQ